MKARNLESFCMQLHILSLLHLLHICRFEAVVFQTSRSRSHSDSTSLEVLDQDAASLCCSLPRCCRIISPKSIWVFGKGFSRNEYPTEAAGNIGWGKAMTTVSDVGVNRNACRGLTISCSGFPCSRFSPVPCSISALIPIPLELSIVSNSQAEWIFCEDSLAIPSACRKMFLLYCGDHGVRCRRIIYSN